MQNVDQIEQWLNVYTQSAPKNLRRMKNILADIGHPELKAPAIHVTGTNGKGSTCRYMENIARNHGYSTLLFTSPHLETLRERIRYNQENIHESDFVDLMNNVRSYIEKLNIESMTYFEVLTLAFYIYASKVQVDVMIVEVGIGGKTDYTNVLPKAVRVITSIGRDHIPGLGKDETGITQQKAGIIHHGDVTVIGEIEEKYVAIIQDKVNESQGQLISYQNELPMEIPQLGFYQEWNARTALAAWRQFTNIHEYNFDIATAKQAIVETILPGRLEELIPLPATYIDGAHNISAIKALVSELENTFSDQKVVLVFASLQRKEIKDSLDFISRHSNLDLVLTTFNDAEAKNELDFSSISNAKFVENWYDYYMESAIQNLNAVYVFCGSFYFISEVREKLQSEDIYEKISNF